MTFRKLIFWPHLICGCIAGIVILIMSVTGVLLTYEQQMIAWADRGFRSEAAGATRLNMEDLLASVRESEKALPTSVTVRADAAAPVEAVYGRGRTVYVDPYSGRVLGEGSKGIREFFHVVTDWHRWLGAHGESRAAARAVTGASNLAFLFIVVSGLYLWWPKIWTKRAVGAVTWFRGGLAGKARDFNWHNVIGFWCCVPLFAVVLTATVMSYQWANNLLYTLTGTEAPRLQGPGGPGGAGRGPGGPERGGRQSDVDLTGINALWSRAEQQYSGWQSISLRVPQSERGPAVFTVDLGTGRGRPDKRYTLTINRRSGEIVRAESFADNNLGRKLRMWFRFIHTGEAGGWIGQTIAGIASAGATMLVYTGIVLSLRRFVAWRARRRRAIPTELVSTGKLAREEG